jgi:hypothetical protein
MPASIDHVSSLVDIAQIASAVGAVGAAGFAWRAVSLATRQQRQADEPYLSFEVFGIAGEPAVLSVENIGGGMARKRSFRVVTSDDDMAAGWITRDGRIRPGQRVDLLLPRSPAELVGASIMTLGLDRWHRVHAWSHEGDHKSWPQRRWARAHRSDIDAFERFYPRDDVRRAPTMPFEYTSQ